MFLKGLILSGKTLVIYLIEIVNAFLLNLGKLMGIFSSDEVRNQVIFSHFSSLPCTRIIEMTDA